MTDLYSMVIPDYDRLPPEKDRVLLSKAQAAEIAADVRYAVDKILDAQSITGLAARLGKMPQAEVTDMLYRLEINAGHLRALAYALDAARIRALVALAASGTIPLDPDDLLEFEREEAAKASEAA